MGEPCFDKFEAKLAQAMLSIPASKGFEIGSGINGTKIPGHAHNDPFEMIDGKLRTTTNFSGGIQGKKIIIPGEYQTEKMFIFE